MRHHRRNFGKATYAILLLRVGEFVRTFVVGFDGYAFCSFEDTGKVLDYGKFREIYKVCPAFGEMLEIQGVFCWKYEQTFYAFTQIPQLVDFSRLAVRRVGNGIYDALGNAVDDAAFDVLPALDAGEFVSAVKRVTSNRYTLTTGSFSALDATGVLGEGGLVNAA